MINVAARGEPCQSFHSLDVTKLRCYCALHPSLENYPGESNLQLNRLSTRYQRPVSVIEAIVFQAGYIFYLFMIIRYENIFIEWAPYLETSLIRHLSSKYE